MLAVKALGYNVTELSPSNDCLSACGNSKLLPGKRFPRRFPGYPQCPTMLQEGVVAPLCASAFRADAVFRKHLLLPQAARAVSAVLRRAVCFEAAKPCGARALPI